MKIYLLSRCVRYSDQQQIFAIVASVGSDPSARFSAGGRVLSVRSAAVDDPRDRKTGLGLVVSGISNWPVAITRRKPVSTTSPGYVYRSLPPCALPLPPPVRLLPFRLFSFTSSYSSSSCTHFLICAPTRERSTSRGAGY